ncbi:MAG: diguanylate cyclase [Magnetococcales bacterium]|nr:diguanylate cyclase [Magnetococcales bacterium]
MPYISHDIAVGMIEEEIDQAALMESTLIMNERLASLSSALSAYQSHHYTHFKDSLTYIKDHAYHALVSGLTIGGASLVIMSLISYFVGSRILSQIVQMGKAMENVTQGDMSQFVPVTSNDELGWMAKLFNSMSGKLKETYFFLQQEQDKLSTIILSAKEGIIVTDQQGKVVLVNPSAEFILEKSKDTIVAGGFYNILDDPKYLKAFLDNSSEDIPDTIVYRNKILNILAATMHDNDGRVMGSSALIRDVTQEKKLEEQLRNMSYTDKLTGLYNRRRMEELMAMEYERGSRTQHKMAVLFFDVDHFKKFNDTYGHDVGDDVLALIGKLCKSHFRKVDYCCRYGGEEFCMILPNTNESSAIKVADRFRESLQKMPVNDLEGVFVTTSIGIALHPQSGIDSWEILLKRADAALYAAKRGGRNMVVLWDPEKHMEM